MNLISIVGHSGSGKTTLIEKLVRELTQRGLRVATIKHAHHKVEMDTPGKDSWRYTQAGATMSLLVTQGGVQLVDTQTEQREPQQLAERFLGEADLVLAEGFSHAPGAKIEVLRRACFATPRCTVEEGVVALVTDVGEAHPQLPHFTLDDVDGIIAFILQQSQQ
ncbi:MAG: molybdopterin-guanine dinucleotide biosynthesis protein B [Gammaproteobacteria bacterium]|nr:molybdopterin-guanine dinucleotide biosynthesis protein B [Gammaproteobacteria bacterium]MBU1625010.1 molybdopterin-guanine dinucleotide biosynthesis protein B [Gammaproteobacteria bacterium]MBU1981270.1 molybdopterin-guanine dinucleotide biosynthesis protein B [Gammaproteobacteria bacterium]